MEEKTVFAGKDFFWLDVLNPTAKDLNLLAKKYNLPQTAVKDCLDAEHLPKYERIGDLSITIFRAYDERCSHDADTVLELTRKIAVFRSPHFLITIHRKEQPYVAKLKEKWINASDEVITSTTLAKIWTEIVYGVFNSYEKPIDEAFDQLELLEMDVFEAHGARQFEIKEGYYLKRKSSVFKRMIRVTLDLLPKMSSEFETGSHTQQDLRELAESYYFYADELTESVNSLLNLYLSLASQRTNEVMRVLTIFSIFLLPLNVITGIYGMNFEHMPELKWPLGYPMALLSMALLVTTIYLWFRHKGWLK